MCGIIGFIDFNKKSSRELLSSMTNSLRHRGEDGSGEYFIEDENFQLGLGHRRLSIIDLTDNGKQPMHYQDLSIIFNGEIYNFKEIRNELLELNHNFETESDTEVVIKAFHEWGLSSVAKFNGMFAIAIFDNGTNKITLIRDRAGVKPLFWYFNDNLFIFSSELKGILSHVQFTPEININSLAQYLSNGFISNGTIYKDINKLNPGSFIEIDLKTKKLSYFKYWDLADFYKQPKISDSYENIKKNLIIKLEDSCRYRLISDAKLGVFLSGGYDSSLIAAICKGQKNDLDAFTVGFDDIEFDESIHAKKIANYLGVNHHVYMCTKKEAKSLIFDYSNIFDEPISDISCIPAIILSRFTKQHVKVALSADGGDELFGGYKKYNYSNTAFNVINKIPYCKKITNKIIRNFPLLRNSLFDINKFEKIISILNNSTILDTSYSISGVFNFSEINELLIDKQYLSNRSDLVRSTTDCGNNFDTMMLADFYNFHMEVILVKVDRSTMASSLEAREPLLDYKLAEYAATIPTDFKIDSNGNKKILKDIAHTFIPEHLLNRSKMGFTPPMKKWMKDFATPLIAQYLSSSFIEKQNIFNPFAIKYQLNSYRLFGNNFQKIWNLLIFQIWYEKWILNHNGKI